MAGPPPPEAIEATVSWAMDQFGEYYRTWKPWLPPRFGRREFGFLPIAGKFFDRHRGFRTAEDLAGYVASRVPGHAYYSVAYYQTPDAPTMKEKGWLGADLIFDLDADHLPEVRAGKDMPFEEQLNRVRDEAVKLLHEFVLGDLGFDERHVRVVFSGGRGYHIHIDDPRVQSLGAAERREIVDYVTGLGFEAERFTVRHGVGKREFQGRVTVLRRVQIAPDGGPHWGTRYRRSVQRRLEAIAALPREEALVALQQTPGVGPVRAERFYEEVGAANLAGTAFERMSTDGDIFKIISLVGAAGFEELGVQGINEDKGEADEPVTADIKRLIRLPESLHGKTGLRVVRVANDKLATFDPLREAIAFGARPVDVVVSKPERFRVGDESFDVKPGLQTLPLPVALFLILRRKALRPWAHAPEGIPGS
ncbi:MAG: DNA primase small subunit domain-containing protein [Thermoplasmatota archaeon]